MSTTSAAPRAPVTVSGVLDDPELAWRLCQANGPYAHVLMLREFAASLDAYREAARRGSPDAVGVMVDDELMTMPIYRGDWVSSREVHIDGVDDVLHNERLVAAAQQVFDAEVVRPLIVFSNLTAPMPQNRKHTDVPTFRGVERSRYPAWVVSAMAASGLFERWRVKVATAVAWYYDGPNGGFSYWPDGGDAPEVTIEPPSNTAVVGDNDFMYHRVEAVGDGRFALVPIDSLLVVRRPRRAVADRQGRPCLRRVRSRRRPHQHLVEGGVLPRRRRRPHVRRAPRRHLVRAGPRPLARRLRRRAASCSPTRPTRSATPPSPRPIADAYAGPLSTA